jgi:hypothetical protein
LIASLAIVLTLVLITVRPEVDGVTRVDWHEVHASAPNAATLVDPTFSAADGEWWSNRAEYTAGANPEWYIGFITPDGAFVSVRQFLGNVPPDLAAEFDDAPAGTATVAGVEWQVIDRSGLDDPGNDRLIYVAPLPSGGSLIVSGTADATVLELVAERAFSSVKG